MAPRSKLNGPATTAVGSSLSVNVPTRRDLLARALAGALVSSSAAGTLLSLSGCGGGSDDPANTLLSLSDITGTTALISDNTASTYSATVTDPDGIVSVTAKLDGVDLTVTASSGTYSVTTPAGMSVGSHTLVVTAIGRLPNGSNEVAVTAEVQITVQAANTVLVIGSITGADSLDSTNTVSTYSITPVDPDGIASVTATLDGTTLVVSESSGVYSVSTPASLAVGSHTLVFTAVGAKPDGTTEESKSISKDIEIVAIDNTPPAAPIFISITGENGVNLPVDVVVQYDEPVSQVTVKWVDIDGIWPDYIDSSASITSHSENKITIRTVNSNQGNWNIFLKATDAHGNQQQSFHFVSIYGQS